MRGLVLMQGTVLSVLLVLLALTTVILAPAVAMAEDDARPPHVTELETIIVTGVVPRPNAFYMLNRARIDYESRQARASFVRELTGSVHADPF